jgi:hypothetical protein
MSAAVALTVGLAVLAIGCTEQSTLTDPTDVELKNGPPDGGGGPPDGKGPGGGGHEPGATNNLSVPLINIGGSWTGVTCTDEVADFADPTGQDVHTGYDAAAGYYYVQGLNTWQAECENATSASAGAYWGDNLSGDAKLKVNIPIRVEIGLETNLPEGVTMPGFVVTKLENTLDRESAYGTFACNDPATEDCSATVTDFNKVRVFDNAAEWRVLNGDVVVREWEAIGSEINATGKAVYGYGLRLGETGAYTLQFRFPNVTITSVNYGTFVCAGDPVVCTTSLDINVVTGGGGGGGKPH